MAATLNKLYVKTFETRVRFLAQQTEARLRPWVQENSEAGNQHSWGRMGKQSMAPKVTRRAPTPANDSVWSDRISVVGTYDGGDTTEQEDINQVLIDPNASITKGLANAARRQTDDIIIAACGGTALDQGGANNAFPAGQILGNYTTEIDFPAVTLVNDMFLSNDVPADEEKVFVIGPHQARKLLHIAQATQTWYVEAKQLVTGGFIKNWMGFDWVVSNRLLHPLANQVQCFAFTRNAMGLQVSKDVWARVGEDPSISFAWRIYTALSMGAVRVEDEQIVQCQFADTTTVP